MTDIGTVTPILMLINIAFSYKGFISEQFFDKYKFNIDRILVGKEYTRLITSGFLHADWKHLIFNMISLYFFSGIVEAYLGAWAFCAIYFASLIGGNLLALLVHRNHGDYSAIGASGAVCGIIFSSIALFPGMGISKILIPISIPGWLYGVLYVSYSIYGIRSQRDNIGHEAHLGGALIGMAVAILFKPSVLTENYFTILIIVVPTILFIYMIITRPQILLIDNFFFKTHRPYYNVDQKYNHEKMTKQNELDTLLDKISKKGFESLTKREKQKLEEYSK